MGRRLKPLPKGKKKQQEKKKRERKNSREVHVGESSGDRKWVNLYRFYDIPRGDASPDSCDGAVGRVLGAHGVNVEEFCKKFNDRSRRLRGWFHTVEVAVYDNQSCSMYFSEPFPYPVGHPKRRLSRGPIGLID